ncbi:hypothetical protein SLA2020_375460 [Shorea laevis]
MSSKTSSLLRWHHDNRSKDGLMRHPVDSQAWKAFDERYKDFAQDPRNVRFGLASDGFNPFRLMSSTYSIWPVVLIPYNLPPWLCMKQSYFILSMIIPSPKSPGNDIDVYLQPLIDELKELWAGVATFDATSQETFNMRAALMWTINDFQGMSILSGRSTKGRYGCPHCGENTCSRWLKNGKKFCYLGHRRWLGQGHYFRNQAVAFDGTKEFRTAPNLLSGTEILRQLKGREFSHGKMHKRGSISKRKRGNSIMPLDIQDEEREDPNDGDAWKKQSIFFELPYWESNLIRHVIDFMHTEKNIGENCVSTFLNEKGKSKDNLQARLDLEDIGIRPDLHPKINASGRMILPPAPYTLSAEEKAQFCEVFKNLKVPDGYASNISRSINLKEHKMQSLKSHDYHILVQDLLPVALRCSMPKKVTAVMIEFCNILKALCSKVLNVDELDSLQNRAAVTLCHMERIFPPSFFTIMIHLVIHLPQEANLLALFHLGGCTL